MEMFFQILRSRQRNSYYKTDIEKLMQNFLFSGELSGIFLKYVRVECYISKHKIVFEFKIGTPNFPIVRISELAL